jgi:hypothetical protein
MSWKLDGQTLKHFPGKNGIPLTTGNPVDNGLDSTDRVAIQQEKVAEYPDRSRTFSQGRFTRL